MNSVQILGTMTRDCEIKYTQSETAVSNFGIAYNERVKDAAGQYQDKPHFFEITAWGKNAENINSFFRKGSRILISGSLDFSSWEKDGQKHSKVGIKLERFDFIDRKADTEQQTQHNSYQEPAYQQAPQQQPAPQQGGYTPPPPRPTQAGSVPQQPHNPHQGATATQQLQAPTAEQIAAYMAAQHNNMPQFDENGEEIPF